MIVDQYYPDQQGRATWEADVRFTDRYLIDNVPVMPEWKPRVWHFDLEWDPKHDFTTVMAISDNYNQENYLLCWSEEDCIQHVLRL